MEHSLFVLGLVCAALGVLVLPWSNLLRELALHADILQGFTFRRLVLNVMTVICVAPLDVQLARQRPVCNRFDEHVTSQFTAANKIGFRVWHKAGNGFCARLRLPHHRGGEDLNARCRLHICNKAVCHTLKERSALHLDWKEPTVVADRRLHVWKFRQ